MLKIASWNVNGIRACAKSGFVNWFKKARPDILALQEVRASEDQIPEELHQVKGYSSEWFPAISKKGYSGVALLSRKPFKKVLRGLGEEAFDNEGRVITGILDDLVVVSAYFPNSQDKGKRIDYKIAYCQAIHKFVDRLRIEEKKPVILTGDFNIAHQEVDLARPNDNHHSPGFLPREREWMDEFIASGWVDSFRKLHPKATDRYSWWSARTRARDRNIGWRIDYHCLHSDVLKFLKSADIKDDVMGSDHCPVTLTLV